MTIKLGTRGSKLAMAQSTEVAEAVTAATGHAVELVEIVTSGDRSSAPVATLGVGVFVSALREALADGTIDVAVHSYKDLPTAQADGLTIAAVPARQDPRDALVASDGRMLTDLPSGARIGTGAPRRIAQLLALGRDFECVPIRGNVDTRIRRVSGPDADLDAVVLAAAGLARLGRSGEITEMLDPLTVLPAPAQGALAVECRTADTTLIGELGTLDDRYTSAAVRAERELLARLEAGCSAPVAGLADVAEADDGFDIYLRGSVLAADGSHAVRLSNTATVTDDDAQIPVALGRGLAEELLDAGADKLLAELPT